MAIKAFKRLLLSLAAASLASAMIAPSFASANGGYHSCAVLTSGKVNCWGYGTRGQLGMGANSTSRNPVEALGLTGAAQVGTGGFTTCAVLRSGKVYCWGRNNDGQLANGRNGPDSNAPVEALGISDAIQVTTGDNHSCAVLASGSVKCWGMNQFSSIGDGSTVWNRNTPVDVSGIRDAVQVSAHQDMTCAVLRSGKVMCWGFYLNGALGNNSSTATTVPVEVSGITNAVGVSAGTGAACAVLSTGKVMCWGQNDNGELGNNSMTGSKVPVEVSSISNAVSVSMGMYFGCALLSSGKVNCWGYNGSGNLGNNTLTSSLVPVEVSGITTATQIIAGDRHVCALLSARTVYCWGNGEYGQMGAASGALFGSKVPVKNAGITGAASVGEIPPGPADTTAPTAPGSFTGVPSGVTGSASATVGFTLGEAGGTVECRVDSGSWGSCSSVSGTSGSVSLSALADGSHSVSVRQTDDSGNVSAVGTSSSWTVDRTPPLAPSVVRTSPSAHLSNETTASIAYSGEAGASLKCSLDGGSWAACSASPVSLSSVADGLHTFSVKAVDAAGNESPVASVTWDVDTVAHAAPVVDLSSPAGSPTNSTSAVVAWEGASGATYVCSLDGASYADCPASPATLTGLGEGSHTFRVKARDGAGNLSDAGSVAWVVDLTAPAAPVLSLDSPSASPSRSKTASISYSGEAGATFTCSLDGDAWRPCEASPEDLDGLADGSHALRVRATDAAGNTSDSGSVTWTVDTTAPDAPVLSGAPSGSTTSLSAAIGISGESGATFTCSLDGDAYESCGPTAYLISLATGAHSFSVRATDAAGNTSVSSVVSWTVRAPVGPLKAPSILTPPAGTMTAYKDEVVHKWAIKVGLLFSNDGDTRSVAALQSLQVAVDSKGRPVSARPSDSQPAPTRANYRNGVVYYGTGGDVLRQSIARPVWVRAGNRGGKWSPWVKLTY